MKLSSLQPKIKAKRNRLGRGPGSGLGKTSGRGEKGAGSRSGYKRRYTYEGGQFRLFQKLPTRGFTRARFKKPLESVNLGQINKVFKDGDVVSEKTLKEKGILSGKLNGIKLLAQGEITLKNVTFELTDYSKSAIEKLEKSGLKFNKQ